jgi:hypothetical protein
MDHGLDDLLAGYDGEREAAELAAREREHKRAEMLRWCQERNAQRVEAEAEAARSAEERARAARKSPRPAVVDNGAFQAWTKRMVASRERGLLAGIADVIGEERQKLRAEIVAEREARVELVVQFQELQRELAELRGEIKARFAIEIEQRTARPLKLA